MIRRQDGFERDVSSIPRLDDWSSMIRDPFVSGCSNDSSQQGAPIKAISLVPCAVYRPEILSA